MTKRGRPGIPYEKFVQVWEQLLEEGHASNNKVCDVLGGGKATIAAYRERYEQEKHAQEINLLNEITLSDTLKEAISSIKIQEISLLKKKNEQLEQRIEEYLKTLKDIEANLEQTFSSMDDLKQQFEHEKLELERKLAASQARVEDLIEREKEASRRCETIMEHCNQFKEAAAVAKKEVELLRERKAVSA